MNKKVSLGAAVAFSAIVAAITFALTWMVSTGTFEGLVSNLSQRNEIQQKIDEIDTLIRNNFVGELDETALKDAIARGYISGLDDPYAAYFSAEELKAREQEQEGYLTGIGITASPNADGYIEVFSIYDDSPASSVGLEVGDLIVKVDGQDVQTVSFSEAVEMLKGDAGTSVAVTVRREGKDTEYEITRQKLEIKTVSYRMIGNDAYIRISSFKAITVSQFEEALDYVQEQGAEGIIFDVRNNTGGTVNSVVDIMDLLLPEGTLGHYEFKDGTTKELGSSDGEYLDLPMVVLINGNTASAAELFAANLKDYDAASLVGVTTFGKGVSQSLFTLSGGGGISITTAYFFPAKSENFNEVGIMPDFEIKLSEAKMTLFSSGTLEDEDDTQLQKAIDVLVAEK